MDARVRLRRRLHGRPLPSRSRNLSYIPEHNVFLLELAGKDRGPEIWSYRVRKGAKLPEAPSGLDVVTETGKATLTWKGSGEAKVYRAQADHPWEAKYAEIGTSKDSRFQDEGLAPGKTYFYRVGIQQPYSNPFN